MKSSTARKTEAGPLAQAAVLSKAVTRAADRMGISRTLLAKVLGASPATVTRLFAGNYLLDPSRKEWEFGLLFVRALPRLSAEIRPIYRRPGIPPDE